MGANLWARTHRNLKELHLRRAVSPAAGIRTRLKSWAAAANRAIDDKGYVRTLDDNFFEPLSACTLAELAQGDGAELGGEGVTGKIQALHSSAALVCNLFDYWRGRDTTLLATALGAPGRFCSMQFEAKFPTGLRGKAPNLDLLLGKSDGGHLAIESKFLEPYAGAKPKPFKEKYFTDGDGLWERVGLPRAELVARRLRDNPGQYRYLDAQQLFKHLLGLGKGGGALSLLYLWFDVGGDAGREHAAEIGSFLADLDGLRVPVLAMRYQVLYQNLSAGGSSEHRAYLEYLGGRYFAVVGA